MAKGRYRAEKVQDVSMEQLLSALESPRAVLSVDVAKKAMVGGFSTAEGKMVKVVRWCHPEQTPIMMGGIERLRAAGRQVDVVLEPTGTYGESLRFQSERAGASVFRVGAMRSHLASQVLDGVASWHDAKSVYVLEHLHRQGLSEPWPADAPERRAGRALVNLRELYAKPLQEHQGRLEAVLAAFWPELGELAGIGSKSVLALLAKYGGPGSVAANAEEAAAMLVRSGRGFVGVDKAWAIVESAARTQGVPMVPEEVCYLHALADELLRLEGKVGQAQDVLRERLSEHASVRNMAPVVGWVTAAVLVAIGCDPAAFASVRQYVKTLGLNLRVRSSGKHEGKLKLSKRGNATARRYLYLAALKLIRSDKVVWAWHVKHRGDEGQRLKSVVAVMRKLAKALWHVARGSPFDATKLFDVRRLDLNVAPPKPSGRRSGLPRGILAAAKSPTSCAQA